MKTLKHLLEKNIQHAGLGRSMEAYTLLQVFSFVAKETVPEKIFHEIQPIFFRDGMIKVQCSHPYFAMCLKSYEPEVVRKMNIQQGKDVVEGLMIMSGEFAQRPKF